MEGVSCRTTVNIRSQPAAAVIYGKTLPDYVFGFRLDQPLNRQSAAAKFGVLENVLCTAVLQYGQPLLTTPWEILVQYIRIVKYSKTFKNCKFSVC